MTPSQVKLTLVDSKPQIAASKPEDAIDGKNGILRWDVETPARAAGVAKATATVTYHLRLEYDKQMSITGLAMNQ